MTTQEELKAKRQEMKDLCAHIANFRKTNPEEYYYKAEYTLQEQYSVLHREEASLRRKLYLESCNCRHCEDSGYLGGSACCSDENCQNNVICYECDIHLENEKEDQE